MEIKRRHFDEQLRAHGKFIPMADEENQAFLDMIRSLSGRPGVVWVEYAERPEEWAASEVALSTLLAAMVSVRDLLGREAMDMAVYSRNEGVEVFLDHLGELEVRSGSWNESRFRAVLERVGFRCAEDIFLPGTAEAVREPLDPAWRTRLAEARDMLGLAPVGPRKAVGP